MAYKWHINGKYKDLLLPQIKIFQALSCSGIYKAFFWYLNGKYKDFEPKNLI
jgi:hypothetical protein